MSDRAEFEKAKTSMSRAFERKTDLCEPFLRVLPVTGAAVSVLNTHIGQSTLSASDPTAEWLDELQFDLGEGPCWDAMSNRAPVLHSRLGYGESRSWPLFTEAVLTGKHGPRVTGVFAFPLVLGSIELGAVDLYSTEALTLTGQQVSEACQLATLATWQVLRQRLADDPELGDATPSSRREIHQAAGMILVQAGVSIEDASLLLRAHAFAAGRTVLEVATDVVDRLIDFSDFGGSDA